MTYTGEYPFWYQEENEVSQSRMKIEDDIYLYFNIHKLNFSDTKKNPIQDTLDHESFSFFYPQFSNWRRSEKVFVTLDKETRQQLLNALSKADPRINPRVDDKYLDSPYIITDKDSTFSFNEKEDAYVMKNIIVRLFYKSWGRTREKDLRANISFKPGTYYWNAKFLSIEIIKI